VRKGFIAGLVVGGLVGAYYGMQMTVREKSDLRDMAVKFASRGKRAMHNLDDASEEAMNAAQDILE